MLAGITEGARHVFRVQTPASVDAWGALTGESLYDTTARMQTPEVLRLVIDGADSAMDTGDAQTVLVPFLGGLGSVLFVPEGGTLFSRWEWINEPPPVTSEVRLAILAEHHRRLAWALREGRPLPHVPAVLLAARAPRR